MADNATAGAVPVLSDGVTTTNGTGHTEAPGQRIKLDSKGVDGAHTDVSSTNPLPVYTPEPSVSGNITALDAVAPAPAGAGAQVTGASTAGSLVAIPLPGGESAWTIQVSGTWTGTLYFEGSIDSTNGTDGMWINTLGRQTGIVDTQLSGNTTVNGLYRGNAAGFKWYRIRSKGGAHTGTAAIVMTASPGTGAVFLNAAVPSGSDMIGRVQPQLPARVIRNFMMDTFTAAPVADTAMSVVQWYGSPAAAVAATAQPVVVPANKVLRLTSWGVETKSLAAAGSVVLRLRANTGGVAVVGSPLVASIAAGSVAAVAGLFSSVVQDFGPEGMEFAAGTGIAFSLAGYNATGALTLQGVTRFWAYGYEYTALT